MLCPIQVNEQASIFCGRQPLSVSTNEIITVLVEFLMLIKANLAMKFNVERIVCIAHYTIEAQTHLLGNIIVGRQGLQVLWRIAENCNVISILGFSDKL